MTSYTRLMIPTLRTLRTWGTSVSSLLGAAAFFFFQFFFLRNQAGGAHFFFGHLWNTVWSILLDLNASKEYKSIQPTAGNVQAAPHSSPRGKGHVASPCVRTGNGGQTHRGRLSKALSSSASTIMCRPSIILGRRESSIFTSCNRNRCRLLQIACPTHKKTARDAQRLDRALFVTLKQCWNDDEVCLCNTWTCRI